MTISKLSESEMLEAGVTSLSSRPSAPYAWGGDGLTPRALKERFDRLPRLIAERLNSLLAMILEVPNLADPSKDSIAEVIRSGLLENDGEHTLADFFRDLLSGEAAEYLRVGEETLSEALAGKESISRVFTAEGSGSLALPNASDLRLGELGTLTVILPHEPKQDYGASLVFDTKSENGASTIDFTESVKWSGDDVLSEHFMPFASRHYTCYIWYDGAYQGIVRSVAR